MVSSFPFHGGLRILFTPVPGATLPSFGAIHAAEPICHWPRLPRWLLETFWILRDIVPSQSLYSLHDPPPSGECGSVNYMKLFFCKAVECNMKVVGAIGLVALKLVSRIYLRNPTHQFKRICAPLYALQRYLQQPNLEAAQVSISR